MAKTTLGPTGPAAPPDPTGIWGQLVNAIKQGLGEEASGNVGISKADYPPYPSGVAAAITPDATPKKKAVAKKAAGGGGVQSAESIEQQLSAADIWNQLGEGLVAADERLQAPVEAAIGGKLTAPATASAVDTALAAIGLSPKSSAAQWLNANIKQANTNDEPLQAAMNAYEAAYAQGQGGIQAALGQMGQANQLSIATAPSADWVQSLVQHIMSNVNYYGEVPSALAQSLPDFLKYYLSQSGAGGQSASGTETLAQLAAGLNQSLEGATAAKSGSATSLPSTSKAAAGATSGAVPADVAGVAPS